MRRKHFRFTYGLMALILVALLGTPLAGALTPVFAQCVESPPGSQNINCTGTDTDGFQDWPSDGWNITVEAGATVSNSYNKALEVQFNSTIVNNGTIYTEGTTYEDGTFTPGGHDGIYTSRGANITNNGSITANGSEANGIQTRSESTVTNTTNGTILVQDQYSDGIQLDRENNQVVNDGTITSQGNYSNGVQMTTDGNTLTNNGTINAEGANNAGVDIGGANNTVINTGTINATGTNAVAIDGGSGRDVVQNSGTINGDINTNDGDDSVILNQGAVVNGQMNGGAGTDSLTFAFDVDHADYGALAAVINAAGAAANGSLSYHGHTYAWVNFETLIDLLNVINAPPDDGGTDDSEEPGDSDGEDPEEEPEEDPEEDLVIITINAIRDGRLNGLDFAATAVPYCSPYGGVDVYVIGAQGSEFAFYADAVAVQTGLVGAVSSGAPVEIAPEGARLGAHLYALDASTLQINGPDGYSFTFAAGACGL